MTRTPTILALLLVLSAPALARKPRHGAKPKSAAAAQTASVPANLHGIQYLYGSAEAAALTRQSWRMLADYVGMEIAIGDRKSVVLASDATLANPRFVECRDKPPAIVLDVDETAILNLGAEYDDLVAQRPGFDPAAWDRWEKQGANFVVAAPGAKEALDRVRNVGVTVIFNSNRAAANAAATEDALVGVGLGPAKHGETLFLRGDDGTDSAKDGRRATIASHYCVLAMAGDQLVDFSDRFTTEPATVAERRAIADYPGIASLWGAGWFVMPNPVYGKALQGDADDIFPKDKQWRDPGPTRGPAIPVPTVTKAKQ
ncbi:HAD family acid phosphatase [Sphingomonas sp.]|uniref:HAD family acid phosphatase n=1 Tax=Sphingomonas sp. TaxID=28214 RepID=UPI003B3B3BBD